MEALMRSATSVALALSLVTCAAAPPEPAPPVKDRKQVMRIRTEKQAVQAVTNRCRVQLDAIASSYASGDYDAHVRYSAGMLKMLSRAELSRLRGCDTVLIKKIGQVGVAPLLTVAIEYGYRLSRLPTKDSRERYRRLAVVVERSLEHTKPGGSSVLVRSMWHTGHRPYSENVGIAVAALGYSDLGQAMYESGAQPEHLLRAVQMTNQCRDGEQTKMEKLTALQQNCDVLANAIQEAFPQGQRGAPDAEQLLGLIGPGIIRGMQDCLIAESNDPMAKVIEAFEEKVSCLDAARDDRISGMSLSPSATIMSGSSGSSSGTPDALDDLLAGYDFVDETVDEVWGSNGVGMQVTTNYASKTNPGETATVTQWSVQHGEDWASSQSDVGTMVTITNDAGTTVNTYNSQGSMTGTQWEGSGSNDGTYYGATFNDNGTLQSEVIVDQDGTVTVVEYDDDGNATVTTGTTGDDGGDATEPSTPVGDYMPFPCTESLNVHEGDPVMSPLDPYINPDPNAPADGLADDCLTSFISGGLEQCPPSVALCVNELMQGDPCACGGSSTGVAPSQAPACQMMNCGPDAHCDPATGTCRSSTDDDVFGMPGRAQPPAPPMIDRPLTGTPATFRPALKVKGKLWMPTGKNAPQIIEIIGAEPMLEPIAVPRKPTDPVKPLPK